MSEYREPFTSDMVEIGALVGHIVQLNGRQSRKRKNPIGFAPASRPARSRSAGRAPGTFPVVPRFDVVEGE